MLRDGFQPQPPARTAALMSKRFNRGRWHTMKAISDPVSVAQRAISAVLRPRTRPWWLVRRGWVCCLVQLLRAGQCPAIDVGAPYVDIQDYFTQTKFHGTVRAYFFERAYTNPNAVDQNAFNLGGTAGLVTAPLFGWQAGLTLGSTNSLGLNPEDPKRVDATLPAGTIYMLTESYLQWRHAYFTVRGPDQIIDTPWISPSDSRIKPSAFRGVYGEARPFADFEPLADLSFVGLRAFDFNGRAESTFTPTNLYMPGHAGGSSLAALGGETTPGVQAYALKWGRRGAPFNAQLWWHQFYNFSQLLWVDLSYIHKSQAGIDPIFGFQFANQTGDGENTIAQAGRGSAGRTQAVGILAGVDTGYLRVTAAYNGITSEKGAFGNGDLLSPYSTGYATDPLYTTQMIGGMIEKQSAGSAFKVAATAFLLDNQIKAILSYARYYIIPTSTYTAEPSELDFDVAYSFSKASMLDGFSVRNRFGVQIGDRTRAHFFYNRVQLQYQF